jgi:hypothetical protein
LVLELVHTLVGRLACRDLSVDVAFDRSRPCLRTVRSTLWYWPLATSTANTDTIDDIALLGLVTQTACLIRTRWAGSAVDNVQLSELYYALSANVQRVYSKEHLKDVHNPRPQYSNMSGDEIRSIGSLSRSEKGRVILPPSSGHGEGSEGHQTASSCEALQSKLAL